MALAVIFDHIGGTPALPQAEPDLNWQPILSTGGMGVFVATGAAYHVVSDAPDYLLLSVYPLLQADRAALKIKIRSRSAADDVFAYADFHLPCPYCLILVDKTCKTAIVKNDCFGAARFYVHDDGRQVIMANKLGPIVRRSRKRLTVNYPGIRALAAIGWLPAEATPVNGINLLPPDTRLQIRSDPNGAKLISSESRSFGKIFDMIKNEDQNNLKTAAIDTMMNMIVKMSKESSDPIRATLSGGRDSRFIAALALRSGHPVDFATTNYFSEETDVVRNLLKEKIGTAATSLTVRDVKVRDKTQDTAQMIAPLVTRTDGMFDPNLIGRQPPPADWRGVFRLSGLGGELTHGFYYPRDISRTSLRTIRRRLERCVIVGDLVKFRVRWEIAQSVRNAERVWRDHVRESGICLSGLKFADFYFLSERLRRKSALGLSLGVIAPMMNLYFVGYSFHLTGENARRALIQREVIKEFSSGWGEQKFVSLDENVHKERLTTKEDPRYLFELCHEAPVVRSVWGRGWRDRLLKLNKSDPVRATRLIKIAIAVSSTASYFEELCSDRGGGAK